MKTIVFILLMSVMTFTVKAQWHTGAGLVYANVDAKIGDVSFLTPIAQLQYTLQKNDKVEWLAGVSIGKGINEDDIGYADAQGPFNVTVKFDRFMALNLRAQVSLLDDTLVYIAPAYSNVKLTHEHQGVEKSHNDWQFGADLGIRYEFNSDLALEVNYQKYNDTKVVGVNLSYSF